MVSSALFKGLSRFEARTEHTSMSTRKHLPGRNGRHFGDDIFKCIFTNGKFCSLIRISLKFVLKGPIDNKSTVVQVIA